MAAILNRRRGDRRAHAPPGNTARHDNGKPWEFRFLSKMSVGLRLGALQAAGAPL